MVPNKVDDLGKQKWHLVAYYWKVNGNTIDDQYSLPTITDILDKLACSVYSTTPDFSSEFHQIEDYLKRIEEKQILALITGIATTSND